MYKVLTIGGRDYKFEYSIEASLYDDCLVGIFDFFEKTSYFTQSEEAVSSLSKEDKLELKQNGIRGVANIPLLALTTFYAGLIEHHGASGDRTVMSKNDAKEIIREYFKEHSGDGTDTFFDILNICIEQMTEDDFFTRIGMAKDLDMPEQTKPNRAARRANTGK